MVDKWCKKGDFCIQYLGVIQCEFLSLLRFSRANCLGHSFKPLCLELFSICLCFSLYTRTELLALFVCACKTRVIFLECTNFINFKTFILTVWYQSHSSLHKRRTLNKCHFYDKLCSVSWAKHNFKGLPYEYVFSGEHLLHWYSSNIIVINRQPII